MFLLFPFVVVVVKSMTPDPAKNIISSGTCFIVHLDVSQVWHKPSALQQFRLEFAVRINPSER
jgi:hypothetical protein